MSRQARKAAPVANYRPQRSCGKVMFLHLSVILSTGVSAPVNAGIHTPPGRHPPSQTHTPSPCQTPTRSDTPGHTIPPGQTCWDTVSKRALRILLECTLVYNVFGPKLPLNETLKHSIGPC